MPNKVSHDRWPSLGKQLEANLVEVGVFAERSHKCKRFAMRFEVKRNDYW